MSEYLLTSVYGIICISVISAVVCLVIGKGAFYNSMKTVCSLAVLMAVLSFLSPILTAVTEIAYSKPEAGEDNGNPVYDENFITETGKYICIYTEELIYSKFSISKDDFSVTVTLEKDDENSVTIKNLTITFAKMPDIPGEIISGYISDTLMCECLILLP